MYHPTFPCWLLLPLLLFPPVKGTTSSSSLSRSSSSLSRSSSSLSRSSSSLSRPGGGDIWLSKEEQTQLELMARKPRQMMTMVNGQWVIVQEEEEKLPTVLDVSEDNDQEPDAEGQYSHAALVTVAPTNPFCSMGKPSSQNTSK